MYKTMKILIVNCKYFIYLHCNESVMNSVMLYVIPIEFRISPQCLNFSVMVSAKSLVASSTDSPLNNTFQRSHYFLGEIIIFQLIMTGAVVFLWYIVTGGVTIFEGVNIHRGTGTRSYPHYFIVFIFVPYALQSR